MKRLIALLPWVGGLFISAIFVDSLRFKFAGHPTPEHIFTTLRDWSGIGLFYPAGPWLIGLGELLSSLLLIGVPVVLLLTKKTSLIGISQFTGALIAFGIMSGAIVFHLFTPLSIQTPIEWDGATPIKFSAALFYSACVSWSFALIIMLMRKDSIRRA
ncbi:MAG: hypothetical protein JKX88_07195 [Marinicaulis sp.]|nr:hypothetical protein [Marinicaulis sp.]